MPAFADASFFIALADPKDQHHARAVAIARDAHRLSELHVHALVVGEVVAVIGNARGGKAARTAYLTLRDATTIHSPTLEEMDAAMTHVVQSDGKLSLSDALALTHMSSSNLTRILSFDRDFDGRGIERIG